jgi:hypothetical protein
VAFWLVRSITCVFIPSRSLTFSFAALEKPTLTPVSILAIEASSGRDAAYLRGQLTLFYTNASRSVPSY